MICPFCKMEVKNIKLHFDRKVECGGHIDMVHFSESYGEHLKIFNREREKLKRKRNLENDPNFYKKAMERSRAKQQAEDPIKHKERQQEARKKQLAAGPDFEKKRTRSKKKTFSC